jgi:RimJ/RimL family protein N-acetyltransferase
MQLTTGRLLLREFVAEDWEAVRAYHADPRYLRFYEQDGCTPEAAQDFVQMFVDQQVEQPRTRFQLAVTRKETGELIGNCGIRIREPDEQQADLGYEVMPEHWGQGYATEAARSMLAFGFTELRMHRIWAWCLAENVGSVRVLQKLGMHQEGHLRENEHFKGRWWDTLIFAILDREWQAHAAP